ncbi:MAG TPA: hypothetical protein VKR24_12440 [Candidatus Limnocylindrales bacterium]|nr:hypothetical protein [Candidatus Limnocylindrales bacterium]
MADTGNTEPEIEALLVDRYLESILLARERGFGLAGHDPSLDPELRAASDWLTAGLVRVHPSFRFEERLARRLADAAAAMRLPVAAGGETSSPPPVIARAAAGELDPARDMNDEADLFGHRARPLLIGGALTSAAVSLAGAAFVAWRLSRPVHPMVRAIRAAHERAGHQGGLA